VLDRPSVHLSSAGAKKYALSFAAKLMETRYILRYRLRVHLLQRCAESSIKRTLSAARWCAFDMYGADMLKSFIVRSSQIIKILCSG
jgi:hypothetical protein